MFFLLLKLCLFNGLRVDGLRAVAAEEGESPRRREDEHDDDERNLPDPNVVVDLVFVVVLDVHAVAATVLVVGEVLRGRPGDGQEDGGDGGSQGDQEHTGA